MAYPSWYCEKDERILGARNKQPVRVRIRRPRLILLVHVHESVRRIQGIGWPFEQLMPYAMNLLVSDGNAK